MTNPIVLLPEDLTGLLPACLIQGERHVPLPGTVRLLIAHFGAFYKEGLRVYDPLTNVDLTGDQFQAVDLWQEASERSGKEVFNTLLITDPGIAAEIAVTYHAFGGAYSRNARQLVAWLAERRQNTIETVNYSELTDIPQQFNPGEHLHLLSHVYGMERVVQAIGDIGQAADVGSASAWKEAIFDVDQTLERLNLHAGYTVEALVTEKFHQWKADVALFNLGVDLMRNYPLANEVAGHAGLADFSTPLAQDNRYVNVIGLGAFAKTVVERCVLVTDTGLGLEFATLNAPNRGSIYAALIGATFTLPKPSVAVNVQDCQMGVYPKNYPETDAFVVQKLSGDERSSGCILMGFNPRTGDAYLGLLHRAAYSEPLIWKRFFFQNDLQELEKLVQTHAVTNNNPHEVDKDQVNLGYVENLPVVTVDDILSHTGTRKYVTMDGLMYHMRVFMENVKLERGADGLVDLTQNPMSDAKIVFAPLKPNAGSYDGLGQSIPPKGQFISSFCDGTDKYTRFTDGAGSFTDQMTQADSDDCKFYNVPKHGEKLGDFCEGVNMKSKYADGKGGVYTELVHANSPDCGYIAPAKAGEVIATFCSGVNQMVRYADGHGGFYDMPSMINTYLCGGSIYPSAAGTTPGQGGAIEKISIVISTTSEILYAGTDEVVNVVFSHLTPSVSYRADGWIKSPALQNGVDFKTATFSFTADAQGGYVKELPLRDDGSTISRGVYDTWVTIASESVESNHINRTFMAGVNPSTPTPAPIVFAPTIVYSTSTLLITPGTNETQTAQLSGFLPNTAYSLSFWRLAGTVSNGAATVSQTVSVTTDAQGNMTYTAYLYDDGTIARGNYTCWTTVDTYKSNTLARSLVATTPITGYVYDPKLVFSSSLVTIKPGDTETLTFVMTKFEKSKNYTVLWKTMTTPSGVIATVLSMVVTTDAAGYFRYETPRTDDGVTVPRGTYLSWLTVVENSVDSNSVDRQYIATPVTVPKVPKLVYHTNPTQVAPGTVETHTLTMTDFPANSVQVIDFWGHSTVYNNNVDVKAKTITVTTSSLGAHTATFTITDDGLLPRGDYVFWANSAPFNVSSATVVRSLIAGATQPPVASPPVLANASIFFTTDHPTISPGIVETLKITFSSFEPNKAYSADVWVSSPALNNGGQSLKIGSLSFTTNSTGTGVIDYVSGADDGSYTTRGEYRTWIVVSTITSNTLIRTFIGTPAPTVSFNPVISLTSSSYNITAGTTEKLTGVFTGFLPNTSYTMQSWVQSTAMNGNTPFQVETRTFVTDQNGSATCDTYNTDDGVTIPRGAYSTWYKVTGLTVMSNTIMRYLIGTPAPTSPPFNPAVSFWMSRSWIQIGDAYSYLKTLSGLLPYTGYSVQSWAMTPSTNGGAPFVIASEYVTTNANGGASLSVDRVDDGTVTRGSWSIWCFILETNTQSAVSSAVFA